MRRHTTLIPVLMLICWGVTACQGQDKIDVWAGAIEVGAIKLRVEFHVTTAESGEVQAEMVSLDQGNVKLAVDRFAVEQGQLVIEVKRAAARYEGKLNAAGDVASGQWTQSGQKFPLELTRREAGQPAPKVPRWEDRPQRPQPPFPYVERDVAIENEADGVVLKGTLTMPAGEEQVPAVILISGSGPQDRDETLMAHKPFLVIADYLSRRGIAVLRYDDRGAGESTGDFAAATTEDFARDAAAALNFLATQDRIDPRRIGLAGHSEGGLIGPLVAANNPQVGFLILLAGPGVDGGRIIESQSRAIAQAMGVPAEDVALSTDLTTRLLDVVRTDPASEELPDQLMAAFEAWLQQLPEDQREAARAGQASIRPMAAPWMGFFIRHDPLPVLQQVQCPILVLQGGRDLQVLADLNVPPLKKTLAELGTTGNELVVYPTLNHLFQECQTGLPGEYVDIDETVNLEVLKKLASWIGQR